MNWPKQKPASAFNFCGVLRIANCSGCLKPMTQRSGTGHWHLLLDIGAPMHEQDILILDTHCSDCWGSFTPPTSACPGCWGYWAPPLGITVDLWSRSDE
jgi:hypothetical protein